MKRLAVSLVIAICVAGSALAQDAAAPSAVFVPSFEQPRRPFTSYPPRELDRGTSALVHLCCTARPDRSLDCRVALEWPEDRGFDNAALRFAGMHRLTEASYAGLQSRPHPTFHLPIQWSVLPAPPELEAIAAQTRAATRDLCGADLGETPEYMTITAERVSRRR